MIILKVFHMFKKTYLLTRFAFIYFIFNKYNRFFTDPIIPQYYYVPKQFVEDEKLSPNSVEKLPSDVSEICLWNQSLYIIVQLLTNNLLHISELDPIRRYLPSYNRPKRSSRYSVFQVNNSLFQIMELRGYF